MGNSIISLSSFTALITPLLLFLASCYYLSKSAQADSILLFIGSSIGLIASLFFSLMPYFVQSRNMPFTEASNYYAIAGVISFFGGICFVAGFFILITNLVKANKQHKI